MGRVDAVDAVLIALAAGLGLGLMLLLGAVGQLCAEKLVAYLDQQIGVVRVL